MRIRSVITIACVALSLWVGLSGDAQAAEAQICPAGRTDGQNGTPPTDWTAPGCETLWRGAVDPTDRLIWVRTMVDGPAPSPTNRIADLHPDAGPYALHLSGRFSARVWLNGTEIGRNGLPGADVRSEAPGLMDAAFHVPPDRLRTGANAVVLLASAHHGQLDLTRPFHHLSLRPVVPDSRVLLVKGLPVLVALGLFLGGFVYFGGLALTRAARGDALILCALCALAGGQLLAEMARPLWAYPYPVHDLRLLAIAGTSAAFGLLTSFYVTRRLRPRALWPVMIAALALSLAALILRPDFDGKSALAMLGPLGVALGVALWVALWPRPGPGPATDRRRAALMSAALALFIAANLRAPALFLDTLFFYLVAALLLVLLVEQLRQRAREAQERVRETARADRLQLLLDRLDPDALAPPLVVRSAGRVEQIAVADILSLQSADGYAEIRLAGGRTLLHSKSLAALETELPPSFLKVHRSHIVNTAQVRALDRDGSGTGTLRLSDGSAVPVSRRILPTVRQALG